MSESLETRTVMPKDEVGAEPRRLQWLGWSAFFFAFVQSVCTGFAAISGLRLLIGVAAFSAATGVMKFADKLHGDAIRIPMTVLALLGSLLNLAALWQIRRLRKRKASAWRRQPLTPGKRNSERLQLALSVATLLLLGLEYWYHWKFQGHL